MHGGRWQNLVWLLVCGILSSAWCVTAGRQIGATFDEPVYIARGLEGWRTGSHHGLLRLGTMPLPADVQTFPLYLAERIRGIPWDLDVDFATLLAVARTANLVFWWLLLVYGWRIGQSLAGDWGGRLAVAALCCEPNLLAHAALATTDIAVTACMLMFAYHHRVGFGAGSFRRVVIPGLCFGVALMAKASSLVFAPLVMLACFVANECRGVDPTQSAVRVFVVDGLKIALIGLVVMTVLCGCDWQSLPSFVAWARQLPDGAIKTTMAWLADHLRIFSNGPEALVRQIKHNAAGHGTFLLGEARMGAFWYYFPVVITIKLTVPLLLAPLVLLAVRPSSLRNWTCAVAMILFAFSLTYRVQIGIRLLLPCVAFAVIGLSAATVRASLAASARRRLLLRGASAGAIAWATVACVSVWPHGLCYVNELWGGRRDGYRLVGDSNYDWGQGLPELARWTARHELDALDVWYFGTDPRVKHTPLREMPFHTLPVQTPEQMRERLEGRYLAVGTSILYGHGLTEAHRQAAAYLRTLTPVGRTTTFLIYDFTHSPTSTMQTRHAPPANREGS
jgi:hypothetical protein